MREREGENDDTINYIRKNDEKHKKNEVIMRWKKSSCMNIINQITMIGRLFGNNEKKIVCLRGIHILKERERD